MKKDFLELIVRIASLLNSQNIKWALTGSASFALQGLPFNPNDIDIQTDATGAYQIEEVFKEYSMKPVKFSSNRRIRSHFGSLLIDGISVEIMGDLEKLVDGKWEKAPDINKIKRTVCVENVNIPVLTLDYEAEAYKKLGRIDKANILYEYIKHSNSFRYDY